MSLFGAEAPTPAPLPLSPSSDPEALRKRQEAEDAALAESKAGGRRSTIVGGMQIAIDKQAKKNTLG